MTRPEDVLKRHWGYDAFRGPQRAAIDAVVTGNRDVLVVMATGGGKSLCMQVTFSLWGGASAGPTPEQKLNQKRGISLGFQGGPGAGSRGRRSPFWSSFCCQWTPETSWVLAHNIPRLLLKDKSFSQIPPLMLGKTGLVVSPLISLMEDQVAALNAKGVRACLLGSAQADWRVREDAWTGKYQLVYLTPELATSPGGLERIRALHERHGGVSVLAVDEAHCISEWGRDFRPDFQRLHKVRDEALGPDVPVVAVSNLLSRGGASAGPTPSKRLTKTGAPPLDPPRDAWGCPGMPRLPGRGRWAEPPF